METFEKSFDALNEQVNVTKFGFTVINVNTKIKLGVVSVKMIRNVQAVEIERNRNCIYSQQNWAQGRTLWDTTRHNANTRATVVDLNTFFTIAQVRRKPVQSISS